LNIISIRGIHQLMREFIGVAIIDILEAKMKRPSQLSAAVLATAACGLVLALMVLPAQAQTCLPQPAGMIAWWPLNETSGTVVSDVLGNHNGTASGPIGTGGPRPMTGFVGGGLNFAFKSQVSVVDSGNDLNFGTKSSFTIDAWIKGLPSPLLSNYNISNNEGYYLGISSNQTLDVGMGNGTPTPLAWTGPTIAKDTWTFVAVVVDRTKQTVTLYTAVPGSPLATKAFPIPNPNSANASSGLPLSIGGCPGNPNGCDTIIDELEIFGRPLVASELQNIVDAGTAGKCMPTKPPPPPPPKGMTWRLEAVNSIDGTVEVGCGVSNPNPCNASIGDQLCTASLPLLCIYMPQPAFPVPQSVNDTDLYNRWSGAIVGTTAPVPASSLNSLAQANARCEQEFDPKGTGSTKWRVAEFHDGANGRGIWNFQAYGNVGNPSSRFWVHINDQKNATCWSP
jgi:hypothetical protein